MQGISRMKDNHKLIIKLPKLLILKKHANSLFSNSLRLNENDLIYFRKQLGNKGKRKFSASRAVFSCNMLRRNKVVIFTC